MLKAIKQNLLKSAKNLRVFDLTGKSGWRKSKLLILAYHGISLEDEHLWNSGLFAPKEFLRRRFELIKQHDCNVLPLNEAVERLYNKTLPQKAVAITFDDGNYDFYRQALPVIKEFNFPVTLYLTTFYSQYNRPVFGIATDYLLWKARTKTLNCRFFFDTDEEISLAMKNNRRRAYGLIVSSVLENNFSAQQKNQLLERICESLEIDYAEFCGKRILQLMNMEEVRSIAASGIDVQLHTHRHRMPLEEQLFHREIEDNRKVITAATGKPATHFCYPSGEYDARFFDWMREANVVSATTCETALSGARANRFLLPRLVDSCPLTEIEFEGWLSGVSQFIPQRKHS